MQIRHPHAKIHGKKKEQLRAMLAIGMELYSYPDYIAKEEEKKKMKKVKEE